jgi:hypothetical protein
LFAAKGLRVLILYHTPITTICKQISEQIDPKFDCYLPLAAKRTPNRTSIRTQICTWPLKQPEIAALGVFRCFGAFVAPKDVYFDLLHCFSKKMSSSQVL